MAMPAKAAAHCKPARASRSRGLLDRREEMARRQPDRFMGVEAGGRIGVAIGRRLDGVDESVDAGRGGQRRGKAERQFGIEDDIVGLDFIAP